MRGILRSTRFLAVLFCLLATVSMVVAQEPNYDPVAEWNGPHYHVINGTGQYAQGKVDDPVIDSPWENPTSVAVWTDGVNYITLVVDEYNDRIQFFETNIELVMEDLNYDATPIQGQFGGVDIYFTQGGVVQGSEVITINGAIYTRVDDVTAYASDDEVYEITYPGAAGTGGHAVLPAGAALASGDVVSVEYTFSSVPATNGVGDIDYSLNTSSVPFAITEILPGTSGRPTTFENLASIALNLNTAGIDIIDLYVIDKGDDTDKLFTFQVEDDATTFAWIATYEGPLSNPADVDIEESGDNTLFVVGGGDITDFADGAAPPSLTVVAVANNALVTNHSYLLTVETGVAQGDGDLAGAVLRIDDNTTGNTIGYYEFPTGVAAVLGEFEYTITDIPGLTLTVSSSEESVPLLGDGDYLVASDFADFTPGTDAVINDFIFVADAGNDRIKVIKGGDNGEALTNGTDTDYFAGDSRTDYYWISDGATTHKSFVAACRAEESSFYLYTGNASGRTLWTRVNDFSGSGASDRHYMYDYDTQVIMLGDGNYGDIPASGDTVLAVYSESIDVLDYGDTGSGSGKFNNPQGVVARYNSAQGWYDVYVGDTGNNRVVKMKFYPGSTVNPASMTWVTSWNYGSSTSDLLDSPTDLAVAEDGADKVYLFVCDTDNDRVVVYRDADAEPTGDGGSTVPAYSSVIGGPGTDLGEFANPIGVSVVANGNDLDIYVLDAEKGYAAKFMEGLSPDVEVDFSTLDANGYPPNSSYVFEKLSANSAFGINAPAGSYIKFYYSDSLDAVSPTLCSNTQVSPDSAEFTWVFSTTPSGAPADGDYYLFAKLYNSSGALLATDQSSSSEILTIDSDLVQGLSIFDPFDDDRYLYLQNASEKVIHFTIDYPDSVVAVNFTGTFTDTTMEFVSIEEGPAWDNLQYNATVFAADWDNAEGTFSINASVLGSNYGLTAGGIYVLAVATVKAKTAAVTTTNRYEYTKLDITSGAMTDYNGSDISSPALNDLNIRTAYLGDIADPDSAFGTLPNMVPKPDGIIGFDDLVVFTLGWNGLGGVQDPIADLGPTTGTAPNLAANPDGDWDVYDLLAFTQMFSWYLSQDFTSGLAPLVILGGNGSGMIAAGSERTGDDLYLSVNANGIVDLMSAKLVIEYPAERCVFQGLEEGSFLKREAQSIFVADEEPGRVTVYMSRLDERRPAVSGSGNLAELYFTALDEAPVELAVSYELAGANGQLIESGSVGYWGTGLPESYKLEQNVPNPFNPVTKIGFQLPDAGWIKLEVFNILGEQVAVLADDYMEAGYHQVEWNSLNNQGAQLSSGLYFYALTAGDFHSVKKMMMLK